ncbi:MAG: hypothetical protein QM723_16320 [Myxococcaceae bacterium]
MRAQATRLIWPILAVALLGCPKHEQTHPDSGKPDSGQPQPKPDSGVPDSGAPDAGLVFDPNAAGVPCPAESFGVQDYLDDGGLEALPDVSDGGMRVFGLCVETRTLNLTAQLNEAAVQGQVDVLFSSGGYQDELKTLVDPFGHVDIKVLKSRYDILNYHPDGIFPNHLGFQDFPAIDMTRNQARVLDVKSYLLRGGARFATLPFTPQVFPPDVSFSARGSPGSQAVGTSSVGGTYEVNLIGGEFDLFLGSPPAALGGTELLDYPVKTQMVLDQPTELDIDIPTSELEGNLTINGKPIPDRLPGSDYQLEYTPIGGTVPVVRSYHDGDLPNFHSLIPKGTWSVDLTFLESPNSLLPAQIYNLRVATALDLSQNNTLDVDLTAYHVEGGILIDGHPPAPWPSYNWTMYLIGYGDTSLPTDFLYYEVPLITADFNLLVFPNVYFAYLYLDDHFAPDLAQGFYLIDRQYEVRHDTTMPIAINTAIFDGKLLIDGKPPPPGKAAGVMHFAKRTEGFYERTIVCNEDGTFRVRLPVGQYTMSFAIDHDTFPEYGSGFQRMLVVDTTMGDVHSDVNYNTVLLTGPIRLDGQPIPDIYPLEEVGLVMIRKSSGEVFTWGFNGGKSNYRLRLPEDDYTTYFEIKESAFPDIAYGTAPFGAYVPAHVRDIPLIQGLP